ncbi:MAG: hypothetical protein WAW61_06975 [Methylococcaceae bacterium]
MDPIALVQFLPVLLISLILWLFNSKLNGDKYIWGVLGAFALAKFIEFLDAPIYSKLAILSGHTLKHLIAAFATLIFYWALRSGEHCQLAIQRLRHKFSVPIATIS